MTKLCTKCGIEKNLECFYIKSNGIWYSRCKVCILKDQKEKKNLNIEKYRQYHTKKSQEWYARTKENSPEALAKRHQYASDRRKNNKSYWVKQFGSKCNHCNTSYIDCVFEFHHLNPKEKDKDPSLLFGRKQSVIESELKKCIMLCANCHRIEHNRLNYLEKAYG